MASIHPTAIVSPRSELGANVSIGPFCVVEDGVTVGDGCELAARTVIKQGTCLGQHNRIAEGAVLGGMPQFLAIGDDLGSLRIGDGNIIREYVTVHRGLTPDSETRIGDANFIMIQAHIAHDCRLGNHIIIANNAMLAGHIEIGDRAYLSGAVGVHQFCRIGRLAMVGGQAHINQDVPPFVTVDGVSSSIVGLNLVGMRRAGLSRESIQELKEAYRIVYRSGMRWKETLDTLQKTFPDGPAAEFHPFLASGQRGFVRERRTPRAAIVPLASRDERAGPSVGRGMRRAG